MTGLEYFRRKNRMTTTEVANILGVARPNVSRWEHKVKKIPKNHLEKLAEIFNTDIESLGRDYDDTLKQKQGGLTGLEFYRRLRGMTMTDLAKILGVTTAVVSHWEKREKPIPRKRLDELAVIFNTDRDNIDKTFTETDKIIATIQYHQQQLSEINQKIQETAEEIFYDDVDPETNETITLKDVELDTELMLLSDEISTDISFYRLLLDLYATVNNITVESCGCSFGSGFVDEYTPFNPNEARETRIRLISNLIKIVNGNDFPDRFLQKICDSSSTCRRLG